MKYNIKRNELENVHFINPPLNNHRIIAQNGAFIMSPLLMKNADPPFQYATPRYIKRGMESAFSYKCIVPENTKESLLKELDSVGFNKATIFTDITNKLQYINETIENEGPTVDLS